MGTPKHLTIGKLAVATNVNVETIRYYQRLELILEPLKPDHGYRQYSDEYVLRVRFIKRCQQLGFTLKEIRELLDLGDGHCDQVQQLATKKIEKIEERIADLQAMDDALRDLLEKCQSPDANNRHCALIETLVKNIVKS